MTPARRTAKIEAMLTDDPSDPELHYVWAMEHIQPQQT